jgi:hypothetical protein
VDRPQRNIIMKRNLLVLVLGVLACSGETLDVGEDDSPVVGSGGTGGGDSARQQAAVAELPDWSSVGACPTTGEDAPQFVGTWDGATEDYDLKPITKVKMVIVKATTDGVCGTISWGTDSPPPTPLTDPAQTGQAWGFGGASGFPVAGLTYTISSGVARDRTLRVDAPASEPWQDFCAMQEEFHYYPHAYAYSCMEPYSELSIPLSVPGSGADGDECTLRTSHGNVVLPLKQCAGCDTLGFCACNASACAADPEKAFSFDLTLDRTLDGVDLLTESAGYQNLRLERVP